MIKMRYYYVIKDKKSRRPKGLRLLYFKSIPKILF